jgi:hypothetical protein
VFVCFVQPITDGMSVCSVLRQQLVDEGMLCVVFGTRHVLQVVLAGVFRPNWPMQVCELCVYSAISTIALTTLMQIFRVFEVMFLQILSLWVVCNYSYVLGGLLYGLVVGRNGLLMHDMVRILLL